MKKILALSIVCAALTACSKQDAGSGQGSAAGSQIDTSAHQQKKQIDNAASDAKKEIKDAAKAQQDKIEADAKAAKAQIEAQKADADAQLKQQQKNVDEKSQQIQQAVGSAQQSISGSESHDQQILQQARDAAKETQGVNVSIDNGTVTLRGNVNSQDQKNNVENRVKQIQGVKDVKDEIKVNNQ